MGGPTPLLWVGMRDAPYDGWIKLFKGFLMDRCQWHELSAMISMQYVLSDIDFENWIVCSFIDVGTSFILCMVVFKSLLEVGKGC